MLYQSSLLFTYFILYAIIGWICEVIFCSIPKKKFINRGFLTGPYCPIYGVGAIVIVIILGPYTRNPFEVFIVGLLSTSLLEYITSWGMEKLFHAKWWDYSAHKFNINGRVCLKNSFLFGIMSLVLMYFVHPLVQGFIENFSPFWLEIFAGIGALIFISDVIESTRQTLVLNKKLSHVYQATIDMKDALKEKGIETAHQLSTRVKAYKAEKLHDGNNADHGVVAHFANALGEKKKLRRFAQRRIINAFPNIKYKGHQDSLEVYKACLSDDKECQCQPEKK
ncbi:MAG: putative ABC transporter permease [Eubacteriaceae bacterium]